MTINEYKKKRDFDKTSEPKANPNKIGRQNNRSIFVVQKHAASQLHYDFRLEFKGRLLSWAIPKGPSLNPNERRLAVQVEDHPLEYADFEGIIPEGEYGGGVVIVWDKGHWELQPESNFKDGRLKIKLRGKKLKGLWNLVKMKGFASGNKSDQWLLIKEKDRYANPSSEEITQKFPASIKTGDTIEKLLKKKIR